MEKNNPTIVCIVSAENGNLIAAIEVPKNCTTKQVWEWAEKIMQKLRFNFKVEICAMTKYAFENAYPNNYSFPVEVPFF